MCEVQQIGAEVGIAAACRALDLPRATLYRHLREEADVPGAAVARARPARTLSETERAIVLEILHAERFVDQAPREIFATLLDEGAYVCSVRTMYRILEEEGELRERRDQLRHPDYRKPELLATGPNQVWSWDITKLLGPAKWTYFYLYVILDIFSRYVVGWTVALREGAELAKRLIAETAEKQGIQAGQVKLHADRGGPMTSKPVAGLLADLGIEKTHSRPHVSNDNPYSESQFKTMKYRPEFPDRFGCLEDARGFCQEFFRWYNTQHHHGGIAFLTPEAVHYGQGRQILEARQQVLNAAYAQHAERFVRKPPQIPAVPTAVWINPPAATTGGERKE